jgi:hypothetical protein
MAASMWLILPSSVKVGGKRRVEVGARADSPARVNQRERGAAHGQAQQRAPQQRAGDQQMHGRTIRLECGVGQGGDQHEGAEATRLDQVQGQRWRGAIASRDVDRPFNRFRFNVRKNGLFQNVSW